MTTTDGDDRPRIDHTESLIEHHRILVDPDEVGGEDAAFDVCKLHAEAWARERGLDIVQMSRHMLSSGHRTHKVGVAFDVTVGRTEHPVDAPPNWTWSAGAVAHWHNQLARVAPGHVAPVVGVVDADGSRRIRPRGDRVPAVLDHGGFDHPTVHKGELHPSGWLGGDALLGPVPGAGPQAGTGQLPPWLRRGTDEDPDF